MFGYINPDKPYLFLKDETLYNAVYCGLCKGIGRECGQVARTSLTYDMAFMSALLHNIMDEDFEIRRRRCVLHWFRRRPVAKPDDTTCLLGALNCVLAYRKLLDDRADGEARGLLSFLYRRGYRRVMKKHPAAVEIVSRGTEAQGRLEKEGCAVIEAAAEPSAVMFRDLSRYILGSYASDATDGLCYAIGKWVYLADALDDYEKDVKRGAYNVFRLACGGDTRAELVAGHGDEIRFVFDAVFADMRDSLARVKFYYNHDLTDNIILRGIPCRSRRIFYGTEEGKEKNKEIGR